MDGEVRELEIKRLKFIDKTYVITLLILLVFGLVVLASASSSISSDPYFYIKKHHALKHRNMTYKDFSLIPSSKTSFVQPKIEDWSRQNKDKKYASQKLMRGVLIGKISLGIKFPLNYAPFVETF